ncbi:hypothetical protein ACFV2H_49480 [Streptomyces sp. NPDC059629]|uniref:hypothetical protein n=1 Tax=Streptomyces sp. NPDC059629 TaxID=3346889 RepID=UPI0036D177F2
MMLPEALREETRRAAAKQATSGGGPFATRLAGGEKNGLALGCAGDRASDEQVLVVERERGAGHCRAGGRGTSQGAKGVHHGTHCAHDMATPLLDGRTLPAAALGKSGVHAGSFVAV